MIHRRELLLVGAGALAAKVTASTLACASDAPTPASEKKGAPPVGAKEKAAMDEVADPHAAHKAAAAAAPNGKATALAAASGACVQAGNACLDHCLRLLADGDTSMGDCAKRVNDMLAVCEATARLSANNSEHLAALAKVCRDVCTACAKACTPHVGHHAECKACKESCDAMVAEAGKFLG